jgi:endoglucanase
MYRFALVILLAVLASLCGPMLSGQTDPSAPLPGSPHEPPVLVHIGAVAPDILALEIQAGRITPMRQVPYRKDQGDVVTHSTNPRTDEVRDMRVTRNGYPLGWLIGRDRDVLALYDRLVGRPLDTSVADQPCSYLIRSTDDPAYARGVVPVAVWRKSKSNNWADAGQNYTTRHYLYLTLPVPLKSGKGYTIDFGALKLDVSSAGYVHDDGSARSEAVHASQLGYRPDDLAKSAFLSIWLGTGGAHAYPPGLKFYLKDEATGERVYTGKVALLWAANTPEEIGRKVNNNRTDVYRMDFGDFTRPGSYTLCVEGIGCSYSFDIAQDVWERAFALSMKGFYHQRSGITLGAPYTGYIRPRGYHPADGVKVYQSTCSLLYSGNGLNALGLDHDNFGCLVAGKTSQLVDNAWGGYMDAGDWDRRIQHLSASRLHLELMELFPEHFKAVSLNIPESGNELPDLVDEALFNIDLYRRLQTPDGGIRGGIEQSEHPYGGLVSWLDTQVSMAYAPDPWASYIYTGVAARAALVLQRLGSPRAAGYRESAIKAMRWADAEFAKWETGPDFAKAARAANAITNERALAAIELYRLTKEKQWHEAFLADGARTGVDGTRTIRNIEAAFIYARLDDSLTDAAVKRLAVETVLRRANEAVKMSKGSAFGFTTAARTLSWGALTVPADTALVRAHVLTGKPEYLESILRSTLYSAGANAMNMTMTTGLGHDWPRHLLHEDSRHYGQPVPAGITIYGPLDPVQMKEDGNGWGLKRLDKECTPSVYQWPATEAYFDVYQWAAENEYTVYETMGPTSYVWGYLAAWPPSATPAAPAAARVDAPAHQFRFALSAVPQYDRFVLVEDFESGTDMFRTWYLPKWSTGLVATYDAEHKSSGKYGLTISNTGPLEKISSMAKIPAPYQEIHGMNALRMWIKPYGMDDAKGSVSTGFIDGSKEIWQMDLPGMLSGTEPYILQIRLADFRRVLRRTNGIIDLEN